MDKQKWLNWRVIGSSDAPAIMGVSKWDTPFQLWEKKVFKKEIPDNFAMRRGREMESVARECFERKMNTLVFPSCVSHPENSWMTATLDGIDMDRKILVEIKCPNMQEHETVKSDKKVPEHYYPQIQHQLEVTGLDMGYYFSFDGTDGVIVEVERDRKYVEDLVEKEGIFYQCMVEMDPPPLCSRDFINKDLNLEWQLMADKWREVEKNFFYYQEQKEILRARFIAMAANRNCKGAGIKVTKSIVQGNVDYKKIPEMEGVDMDLYRKDSYVRWLISPSA